MSVAFVFVLLGGGGIKGLGFRLFCQAVSLVAPAVTVLRASG